MHISVIIPVLNESECIGQLIDFLHYNSHNATLEIIVADGGSTDNSVQKAQEKGAIVLRTPMGRAVQMNAGAGVATAPILYFVHADTLPPHDFVPQIQQAVQQGYSMGCFRYKFDSPNFIMKINSWFTQFYFMFCQGGDKTFFIEKEVFEQMNGYDERYVIMEEFDFLRRVKKAGMRFFIMPSNAKVSARKYQGRSWFKVQIANLVVFNAWQWNLAEPEKLRDIYRKLLG
jgi:rSAM/selenodomain-associated transferase 2